jgi:succinate dehydrogenase/fumarate reductase flavoprotein subunit
MMREMEADVVIVGCGGSGAAAAIEAHDAGASVLIFEKTEEGGGSTQESGGSMRVCADVDRAANHFHALTDGSTPLSMMRTFAAGLVELPGWLQSHGAVLAERRELEPERVPSIFPYPAPTTSFPNFPDSDGVGGRLKVKGEKGEGGGHALWAVLEAALQKRRIKVLYNTPGKKLIRDSAKGVTGVVASAAGEEVHAQANRAVILTCGGFAYNPEMQRQFIGVELPAFSPPGRNTGDGVKMAMDVGADLWHVSAVAASFGFKVPGYEAAFYTKLSQRGFFVVDQKGKRYINETAVEAHSGMLATGMIDPIEGRRTRMPSYLIFDEVTRLGAPLVENRPQSYNQRFPWSRDSSVEIKKGWIKVGATFAELAAQLNLPGDVLEATAKNFNEGCDTGKDLFGREPRLMRHVAKPPFYGIPIWPTLLNTQGGPRRNEKAQIMDVFGSPIPRLYSAGELGSMWGALYPGAGNVCEAIVFGRIAGRNAAGERPIK